MANITRYQPETPMLSLRNAVDRLFEDSWVFPRWMDRAGQSTWSQLPANLYEHEDALIVQLAVPGIAPEDCEVTVRENVLTVRGERCLPAPENATPIWQGFGGHFEQSYTLPWPVESDQVEATYENGILMLHLPKAEQARVKRIQIRAGGSHQSS